MKDPEVFKVRRRETYFEKLRIEGRYYGHAESPDLEAHREHYGDVDVPLDESLDTDEYRKG